ncbi:MAG: hypothetical protein QGG54_03980 [Gammaproteobacteria bacterium]|nr:hypothetical protein [Gammaproteobacteria bacterium]
MEQVLLSRCAVAVITGGPGVGKTTIVSTAAKRVEDQTIVTHIDMRLTDPDLLYDLLLLNLGGESGGGDLATSLYRLKSTIARHNDEKGRKITAVIDVSSLTIERAKRILQLVHMAGEPEGQLNIVLLGPHVLHKLLDTPGLIHMRQRMTFRYRVRPFTVTETEAYLKQQLKRAGGQPDSILTHGTAIMIYQYVGGVPRLINTLMDAVLSHAARTGAEAISSGMITEVTKLLGWRLLSGNKAAPTKKPAATTPAKVIPATDNQVEFGSYKEEPSPLELSSSNTSTPAAAEKNQAASATISEGTAMLMATVLDVDTSFANDEKPSQTIAEDETKPEEDQQAKIESSVPEMDATDTSATGMLRLEDLDARFAETIFGEEKSILEIDNESKKTTA